jgi:hypothetical protein
MKISMLKKLIELPLTKTLKWTAAARPSASEAFASSLVAARMQRPDPD